MMTLPTEREQRIVEEAIRNPEGMTARLVLLIGGEDYGERMIEGEWGQTEIPISLDATLGGVLPRRLENETVRLSVEMAGIVVPQMAGYLSMAETGEDLISTDLLSASAGALFSGENAITFGEDLDFPGNSPEFIVREAAYRMPYEKGQVRIDPLGLPTLAFEGDTGFRGEEEVGAILSRLDELKLYLFRDTAEGGFAATAVSPLSRREPARTYLAQDMPNWRPPPRVELYYSDVAVFSPERRFEPVRATIEYRHLGRQPFGDQTKWIPLEDPTEEGADSAAQKAFDEAERLSNLTHRSEAMLPAFDPLIEKGDPFRVEETFRDDDGTWDRAWACEFEALKHPFGESLDTMANYAGTIVEEEKIRIPALIVPALSAGMLRAIYGRDGDDLYFSASLPWIRVEGDDLIFSGDMVSVDGDDLVIR